MVAWWSFDTFNHVLQKKTKNKLEGHSIFFSFYYNIFLNAKKNHTKNNINWTPNIFSPTTLEKGMLQLATKICKTTLLSSLGICETHMEPNVNISENFGNKCLIC